MPPLLKEICDSEDEDEVLMEHNDDDQVTSVNLTIGEVAPASDSNSIIIDQDKHDDLIMNNEINSTLQESTDSTGELLRQAHLALMAPTQKCIDTAGISGTFPSSSISPSLTHPKRRLSGADATNPKTPSTGKLKRIKTTSSAIVKPLQDGTEVAIMPDSTTIDSTIPGSTIPASLTLPPPSAVQVTPSARSLQLPSTLPDQRQPLQQATPSEQNSSSLTPWSASAIGNSSAHITKTPSQGKNSSDPFHSDDHLVGLPKENYKPRPSRSRSERTVIEDIDFSQRPEKAAKAKRTKTISHSPIKAGHEPESGPRIFPENPILQAPDFEALSPPLAASDAHTQPLAPNMPLLDAQEAQPAKVPVKAKKEPKPKKTPGKRGRPRKNPQPEPEPETELLEEISVNHPDKTPSPTEVRVIIETKLPPGPDVESILQALDEQFPPAAPVVAEDKEESPVREPVVPNLEEDKPESTISTSRDKKPLPKKKAAVAVLKVDPSTVSVSEPAVQTDAPKPVPVVLPAVTKSTPVSTPSKPTTMSWQARSIHRVGLSKTQRTQSLLKVVKGPRASDLDLSHAGGDSRDSGG